MSEDQKQESVQFEMVYNVQLKTREEVLAGKTGYLFKDKESITLKKLENGMYIGSVFEPSNYIYYDRIFY